MGDIVPFRTEKEEKTMKTVTVVIIASLLAIGTVALATSEGCVKTGTPASTAQQEQDAIAIAACVASHWGEDWTTLVTHCAGQSFAVFCDAVADIESAIANKATANPVASVAPIAPDASVAPKTILATLPTTNGRKSYYATQPPIARRLELERSYR